MVEDKHTKYRNSTKGKARDYRRYKKKLAARIIYKQQLLEGLLNDSKIRDRNGTSEDYQSL